MLKPPKRPKRMIFVWTACKAPVGWSENTAPAQTTKLFEIFNPLT